MVPAELTVNARFFTEMTGSVAENWYIFLLLIFSVISCLSVRRIVSIAKNDDKKPRQLLFYQITYLPPDKLRKLLAFFYSFFTVTITVFPLLGMFGTVIALLNLDFSDMSGSTEMLKNNFFGALTSTAWGLVFAILTKIANAVLFYDIDDVFDKLETQMAEEASEGNVHYEPQKTK